MIILLSLLLPLSCLALFLWRRRIVATTTAGFIVLITLFAVAVAVTTPGLLYGRMGLFVISLVGPILFSCWLLTLWTPRVVPLPKEDVERRARGRWIWCSVSCPVVRRASGLLKTVRAHAYHWQSVVQGRPGIAHAEPENVVVLEAGSEIARVAAVPWYYCSVRRCLTAWLICATNLATRALRR